MNKLERVIPDQTNMSPRFSEFQSKIESFHQEKQQPGMEYDFKLHQFVPIPQNCDPYMTRDFKLCKKAEQDFVFHQIMTLAKDHFPEKEEDADFLSGSLKLGYLKNLERVDTQPSTDQSATLQANLREIKEFLEKDKSSPEKLEQQLSSYTEELSELSPGIEEKLPNLSDSFIEKVESHNNGIVVSDNATEKKTEVVKTLKELKKFLEGENPSLPNLSVLERKEITNFFPDTICDKIQDVCDAITNIEGPLTYRNLLKTQVHAEQKILDSLLLLETPKSNLSPVKVNAEVKMKVAAPLKKIPSGNIFKRLLQGIRDLLQKIRQGIAYLWNTLWY